VSRLVRWQEGRVVAKLVKQASIRIAFNEFMKAEFSRRYDASFEVLMHGDDAGRFPTWDMPPVFAGGKRHIVCAGVFDADRLELLDDLEEACSLLWQRGMPASVTILAAGNSEVVRTRASTFKFISVVPSPSHEDLPKALCAADLLIILERFGNAAKGIRLSISSKAHLFMFSSRPILVYAGAQTGVARYAKECGWAAALCDRSPSKLAEAIAHLTTDAIASAALVNRAREVATSNHSLEKIQAHFELLMQNIPSSRDY
jgi:hypothetical protein